MFNWYNCTVCGVVSSSFFAPPCTVNQQASTNRDFLPTSEQFYSIKWHMQVSNSWPPTGPHSDVVVLCWLLNSDGVCVFDPLNIHAVESSSACSQHAYCSDIVVAITLVNISVKNDAKNNRYNQVPQKDVTAARNIIQFHETQLHFGALCHLPQSLTQTILFL